MLNLTSGFSYPIETYFYLYMYIMMFHKNDTAENSSIGKSHWTLKKKEEIYENFVWWKSFEYIFIHLSVWFAQSVGFIPIRWRWNLQKNTLKIDFYFCAELWFFIVFIFIVQIYFRFYIFTRVSLHKEWMGGLLNFSKLLCGCGVDL